MKVLMLPHIDRIRGDSHGIARVIEAYFKYLPEFGVEMVGEDDEHDLKVVHAGLTGADCDVAILHGMYWTADYEAAKWEYKSNANIVDALRHAKEITVPSEWVTEAFKRDMRVSPTVVPHGIDWADWQHSEKNAGYVLWNKNRQADVCSSTPVMELAKLAPNTQFVSTFVQKGAKLNNIHVTGLVPHPDMKLMVQRANVYLSTTKETFGIGALEALASGVPVLGWNHGGNVDLIQHGVNGYLATVGDYEDLLAGLNYCIENRHVLSINARESAKQWTWMKGVEILYEVFKRVLRPVTSTVGIVIPCYNYGERVGHAIESAINQDYPHVTRIIVVDDGSEDEGKTRSAVEEFIQKDSRVEYIHQGNSGVAIARNSGIAHCDTDYIVCLDADDGIEAGFVKACARALDADRSISIAYTGLRIVTQRGRTAIGSWPGDFNYDRQLQGHNQVPTCCLFRKSMWERLGGYRQRYGPTGAGAEDAEFWLRAGAYGYNAIRATADPLFIYSVGAGHTWKDYTEVDWLAWHPWVYDGQHPFASVATPAYLSHPVRQYDEPIVSVIIPVGPGHEDTVINALDGLESQSFRKWEAIVVWDTGEECPDALRTAYPYVRFLHTDKKGPGFARNRGMEIARAPFTVFVDADDWLMPLALQRMLEAWNETESAIYTDFEAHALGVTNPSKLRDEIKYYDERDGYAVISKKALDYNWERAHKQPEKEPYIWNLISTLFPTHWHDEIGGFDESMRSFEDWDYWLRMAMAGKPFARLPEEHVVYLYYSGYRREEGLKISRELLDYLHEKYQGVEKVGCRGCGSSPTTRTIRPTRNVIDTRNAAMSTPSDNDFVLIQYTHPNIGNHHVIGPSSFEYKFDDISMIKLQDGWHIDYGYRGGGSTFLAHVNDIKLSPHFSSVEHRPTSGLASVRVPVRESVALPPPQPLEEIRKQVEMIEEAEEKSSTVSDLLSGRMVDEDLDEFAEEFADEIEGPIAPQRDKKLDLQSLPGVGADIAKQLKEDGVDTIDDLLQLGVDGIREYRGVGKHKAEMIISAIESLK